jgi:hypothetical protein
VNKVFVFLIVSTLLHQFISCSQLSFELGFSLHSFSFSLPFSKELMKWKVHSFDSIYTVYSWLSKIGGKLKTEFVFFRFIVMYVDKLFEVQCRSSFESCDHFYNKLGFELLKIYQCKYRIKH